MNIQTMLSPLIVPLVTTILGAIGIWVQEWHQTRNQRYLRKQAREEAEENLEFFQKWIQAQQALVSPQELEAIKADARSELDKIYRRLLELQNPQVHLESQQPFFQRLLLLYSPPGWLGWVAHLLFYSYLLFFVLATPSMLTGFTQDLSSAMGDIVALIIFFLPALALRAWAVELKRRQHARQAVSANATVPTNAPASMPSKTAQTA